MHLAATTPRVRAQGEEALLLDGPQEHGLLVKTQLPDLVQEEQPPVGGAQQAGAVVAGSGEGALLVAEQGGQGKVPAQGGAVHLHQLALHLAACPLELVHPPGQLGLARAGGPGEQDRIG